MDNSITEITPLVEEILKKTESGEYKWEPMGSNSFCLLAGGYSFTIRSTNFLDGTFGTPVFRFLNNNICLYEYAPNITDRDKQFYILIRKLSDCVEKKYSQQLKLDMQKALYNLNSRMKK